MMSTPHWVEHALYLAVEMEEDVVAARFLVAVDVLFVLVAAPHAVRQRVFRHAAESVEYLAAQQLPALVLLFIEREHPDVFRAEDAGVFDAPFEFLEMRFEIVADLDLAERRADSRDADARVVEHGAQLFAVLRRIVGYIALVESARLDVSHAVGLESVYLLGYFAAGFVRERRKYKLRHDLPPFYAVLCFTDRLCPCTS